MVYAFLVHTLASGPCHVLYSAVFANEQAATDSTNEDLREVGKRQLSHVASRVQSEYSFRRAVGGSISNPSDLEASNELLSVMKSGIFKLYPGEPFVTEKIVIWKGLNNCGVTMVCEKYENRVTAQTVLGNIVKFAEQHCNMLEKPYEVLLKPDRIEAVIHHFLPCGQLLFMNHRVVRQFEKELNLTINNKA
ncbi:AP-5 complex subunit sigma-1-like [Paramuricea clavata]|uniref:AP-5 complex subunit sigma-1-like n=1 Tax=Paramuricea clavata TaxID=317549 RepID=A0A7D9IM35_PARCT|nr:AP-5 complex subunit sigma-1-like [Paramuricea clavata]